MFQVDELEASSVNPDTGHENLSLVDIQRLIKQEKCEAEELPSDDDLHQITNEQIGKKSEASSSKSKKLGNVKRARVQKPSKVVKKKPCPPSTQYERLSNRELLAEMIKSEMMESDVRPVHTCKFCHRNFSSAFILCLHIQIHEKVNSVSKMFEQNNSAAADPAATVGPIENKAEVSRSPIVCTIGNNVTLQIVNKVPTASTGEKTVTSPIAGKLVNIQSKKLISSSPSQIVEVITGKTAGCSSSNTKSSPKIKTESIDDSEVSVKTESTEPVSFVQNNFVENLKKNLSLAMNRKL